MAEQPVKKPFDPFAEEKLSRNAQAWLWATGLQGLCTCVLLGVDWYFGGKPWEGHVRLIVMIGIVATWSLALRTIRERLVELMRCWERYSKGLMRRASESGKHLIAVPISQRREEYIKGSMWRLRLIAAGLTIPFFVMPLFFSIVSVCLSVRLEDAAKQTWVTAAFFTMLSAMIVAGYFHWSILPAAAPVRVSGQQRRFPARFRPR